jgi:hypothetical protein
MVLAHRGRLDNERWRTQAVSPVIRAYYELLFSSSQAEQVMTEIVRLRSAP